MNTLCLSENELVEYTGYRRRAEQIRELSSRGIKFDISANRKLIVVRSHVEAANTVEEQIQEEPILDDL